MAPGLTLVLAAFVSTTSPRAIFSSSLPACDQMGLSDEEAEAEARDEEEGRTALTPAVPAEHARLCAEVEPASPPAVVDCNDTRGSRWVNNMVGSCDMPRVSPNLRVASLRPQRAEHRRDAGRELDVCDGTRCDRATPLPQSRVFPDDEVRTVFLSGGFAIPPPASAGRIHHPSSPMPESPPPDEMERPPRAFRLS